MAKKKNVKKKNNNVKKQFNLTDFVYNNFIEGLGFLKKIKNYVWFSLIAFLIFGLVGYFFPVFFVSSFGIGIFGSGREVGPGNWDLALSKFFQRDLENP